VFSDEFKLLVHLVIQHHSREPYTVHQNQDVGIQGFGLVMRLVMRQIIGDDLGFMTSS